MKLPSNRPKKYFKIAQTETNANPLCAAVQI